MAAKPKKAPAKSAKKSPAKKAAKPKAAAKSAPVQFEEVQAPAAAAAASPSGGFFGVPTLQRSPMGILCLILNIVPYAGIGSIIAGATAKHNPTLIRGILQFVTGWIVVGWIWSIVDGVRMFTRSTA